VLRGAGLDEVAVKFGVLVHNEVNKTK
jgi:hypothetical protein